MTRERLAGGCGRSATCTPASPPGRTWDSCSRWQFCWALRKAELISPARVQRHPFTREVLAELLVRSRRDALGMELRGVAYRAGLPV